MTNQGKHKQSQRTQGARTGGLNTLELSLADSDQVRLNMLASKYRPHSGPPRGQRGNPLYQYSFDKDEDYQHGLQEDLDRLLEEDYPGRSGSPAWAIELQKEMNHGESPLFVHRYLPHSRIEQQFGDIHKKPPSHYNDRPKSKKPHHFPPARKGNLFYRPNKMHQYLTATEVRDSTIPEVDPRLGRPTRTTLLRARQRCKSAPVSSGLDSRKEQMRIPVNVECLKSEWTARRHPYLQTKFHPKSLLFESLYRHHYLDTSFLPKLHHPEAEHAVEYRKNLMSVQATSPGNMNNMIGMNLPEGESIHSFLIGARYNRSHCIDARVLQEHGVYMPRNNPLGCFLIKGHKSQAQKEEDILQEDAEEEYKMAAAPSPVRAGRQAWAEPEKTKPDDTAATTETKDSTALLQEMLNLDDGLNIKGSGVDVGSSARSRQSSTSTPTPSVPEQKRPSSSKRPSGGVLPNVQGTAFSYAHRQSSGSITSSSAKKPFVNAKEVSEKLRNEEQQQQQEYQPQTERPSITVIALPPKPPTTPHGSTEDLNKVGQSPPPSPSKVGQSPPPSPSKVGQSPPPSPNKVGQSPPPSSPSGVSAPTAPERHGSIGKSRSRENSKKEDKLFHSPRNSVKKEEVEAESSRERASLSVASQVIETKSESSLTTPQSRASSDKGRKVRFADQGETDETNEDGFFVTDPAETEVRTSVSDNISDNTSQNANLKQQRDIMSNVTHSDIMSNVTHSKSDSCVSGSSETTFKANSKRVPSEETDPQHSKVNNGNVSNGLINGHTVDETEIGSVRSEEDAPTGVITVDIRSTAADE